MDIVAWIHEKAVWFEETDERVANILHSLASELEGVLNEPKTEDQADVVTPLSEPAPSL